MLGASAHTQGQGNFCTPRTSPCSCPAPQILYWGVHPCELQMAPGHTGQSWTGWARKGNPFEPPAPHRDLSHLLHEVTSCQNSYRMKHASSDSLQAETLWGQSDPELGLPRLAWPWHGVATCTPAAWDTSASAQGSQSTIWGIHSL